MEDDIIEELINILPPNHSYGEAYNELIKAFKDCDVEILKKFIKLGIKTNVTLFDDHSPLTLLIGTSTSPHWQDVAKLLLENGCCPNKRNPKGTPVLSLLVASGEPDLVSLALDKGADLEALGSSGETALLTAVHYKQVPCLKVLLERGSNPNVVSQEGNTAIMWAAGRSNGIGSPKSLAAMKVLLQYGADPNKCNNRGYTPLMASSLIRESETVRTLISAGANLEAVDFRGETAIFKAVYSNCPESVKILGNAGANVNAQCKIQRTPLMVCTSYPVLNVLIEFKANPKLEDCDGYTALHHFAIADKTQFIRLLLIQGACIDHRCKKGNTPLQVAIRARSNESVHFLISRNANVSTKNDTGVNLFHEVIIPWDFFATSNVFPAVNTLSLISEIQNYLLPSSERCIDLIRLLIEKGGDCDLASDEGVTPLMLAALCGDLNLTEVLLIEGRADPHACDGSGRSVLAYACRGGNMSIVKILLQKDVKTNSLDGEGNLPLFYAAQFSFMDIVNLLILDFAFFMHYSNSS